MSARERIEALVGRAISDASMRLPASPEQLREMRAAAPFTEELTWLYEATSELSGPEFDLFEPALFVDVNLGREEFGELSDLTFFGADFASGFFAIDTQDTLDLGRGMVVWMDRGEPIADSLVPCSDTLAGFLERTFDGERPWKAPSLGELALQRLSDRLEDLPAGIEPGPPLDPMAFVEARQERDFYVPLSIGTVLEHGDGLWFGEGRQILRFAQMERVPGADAVVVGKDSELGTIAVTLGGWQSLPADRLFAFQPGTAPEGGRLLGRTADVIGFWIEEARKA